MLNTMAKYKLFFLYLMHKVKAQRSGELFIKNIRLPFPLGWTEAIHQLQPSVQPRHNRRLGKSISSSYELERMRN